MTLQEKFELLARNRFYGIPAENFELSGREQFIYMLRAGLNPDSKVLDIGCGVLRAGYWLIHFLDPGCYCGIEPHQGRLDLGRNKILEPEILQGKRPRFDTNAGFDASMFNEQFDFFLAYSIWTHASKKQIQVMLDNFCPLYEIQCGILADLSACELAISRLQGRFVGGHQSRIRHSGHYHPQLPLDQGAMQAASAGYSQVAS